MLELRSLHKAFNPGTPNEVLALQGVDLTLDDGSFTIIIGTNGSGKSTTLNAVAGSEAAGSVTGANAMQGDLAVGGKVWKGVRLDWFGGD